MSSSIDSENVCRNFIYEIVPLQYSSDADSLYGLLVAAAVLSLAACPFTILLNALVMVAVKTKRRLQTHPNILLACLALTDLMVGLVAQPLHTTMTILLLQGKDFYEFCDVNLAFNVSFIMLSLATSCHLLLISGERYFAIKHSFTHAIVVTKARLMASSALAWVAAALLFLLISNISASLLFAYSATNISSIFLLQILVYKEARRHEQQILSEQVSEEARANFKKEMKALKLTTIILVTIFICFFLPTLILFVTWEIFKEFFSPDVKTLVRHFGLLPVIINSVLNPVIYTVRKREFRVAFIELILKKNFQEAEEFERKLFRSTNNAVRQQDGQEGEGQEQNAEERNQVHDDDNQEDNPQVMASGANFHDNTNLASQNEPVSSKALNSTTTKTEEEHGDGRNPAHPENQQEDSPKVFTYGANLDDNTNHATQNEPVSSKAINSTFKKTEEEHGEGRNPAHANGKLEDNPGGPASGTKSGGNTNFASQSGEHISSNALLSTASEKSEEEQGKRGSPTHAQSNLEDNPGGLASSANFDGNTNLGSQLEPVSLHYLSNALSGKKFEQAEEGRDEGRYPTNTRIKQEDNPGSLASSAYFDENTNTNLALQNESFFSNELDSTSEQTCTYEEHGERENPEHAEVLASGADFEDNINLASQNEPTCPLKCSQ